MCGYRINDVGDDLGSRISKLNMRYVIDFYRDRGHKLDCFAGYQDAVLLPNGDVSVCEMTRPIGNIAETGYDLVRFFGRDNIRSALKRYLRCSCAHDCNIVNSIRLNASSIARILKNADQG